MLPIEGFKRRPASRRATLVPEYPREGSTMTIHDFLDRLFAAYADYAGAVCGASAD
ncbi:hypothetical protein [Pseudomonas oryzae]|uniref:Uncharacterized protein n=1 Tax=Pseudomonas oryzae TaxID=1392877 RepID=A0A1H1WN80_9PSED|nr:hypothetical protein [Pseudomonas oryzae]SDS98535.1 hypothetical protein SAMN05216221_3142 [Pseudomonas oryzae]